MTARTLPPDGCGRKQQRRVACGLTCACIELAHRPRLLARRRRTTGLNQQGAIVFGPEQADVLMSAAHRVRDRQFRWYLIRCQNPRQTAEVRGILEEQELSFVVDHSESGTWFSVPRADRERHEQLIARLTT